LIDGVIDVIATDHAPHTYEEKEQEFDYAPFGINGLETALGLSMRALVQTGRLTVSGLIERMSCNPARIMGLESGTLRRGSPADIVVFDPDEHWTVDPTDFRSRSRNTPIAGWELVGRVHRTIVGGEVRFTRE
jgi:dihydroorotase